MPKHFIAGPSIVPIPSHSKKLTKNPTDIKNGAGPATALFINPNVRKPSAKPDEVLVHVKAFGLNRADTLQRQGYYPGPPHASKILGLEFAGIVEEVGDGEGDGKHKFWKGEEVFGLVYGGGYAEYVVVSKKMLLRKPKELGWEVCAGICEVCISPWSNPLPPLSQIHI